MAFNDTIQKLPDCVDGFVNKVPPYIKATAAVTCFLSLIGAMVILYTYLAFKRYRTKAREIIVHISLMDFTVALANVIGILVDFDARLYPFEHDLDSREKNSTYFHIVDNLCITQAAFAIYGTLSSVLWTTSLTVYFYFTIISDDSRLAKRVAYSFYCICYGLPLLIIIWLGSTEKIGYSPIGGGGWCSFVFGESVTTRERFTIFLGYNVWMYITIAIVLTSTVSILCYLKTQVQKDMMTQQSKDTINSIEKKLLSIPIVFIALRMWSFMLSLVTLYTELRSCVVVMFFLAMGAIGDSGQGLFNAIIFCLMNKNIRQSYKRSFVKCLRLSRQQPETEKLSITKEGLNHSKEYSATVVGIASDALINEDGSHELGKPCTSQYSATSSNHVTSYY